MKTLGPIALAAAAALSLLPPAVARGEERKLLLATTTSVRDSGLMDELLPLFTEQTGIEVSLVAVGSGAALAMGQKGDADVLVTHEPDREAVLVAQGALVDRQPFMENYFVLVGPPEDPARVRAATDAADAMARIAAARAPYVSRGDESGTHRREQQLMAAAGLGPAARWEGFASTGSGMGATLQVAGERKAYTLSDEATFRAFRERSGLEALSKPDPSLRNVYSVSRPNPAKLPAGRVDVERGKRLAAFLAAPETAARIRAFGGGDEPLFTPLAPAAEAKPAP